MDGVSRAGRGRTAKGVAVAALLADGEAKVKATSAGGETDTAKRKVKLTR